MADDFGANFITLTDEDGNEFELEHLDTIEYNGETYMAFLPTEDADGEEDHDTDDTGIILLKVIQADGEEQLSTLDSDEELEAVYAKFMEILFADEDEEENDT
ncbi:MAG TPA: DUF1292 domain-containing protein [Oscillospiraceae bacterium]|nr:DUF1292 domain-containing protein [Oscillospiraceae bacterium]